MTGVQAATADLRVDASQAEWREVGDEVLILNVRTGRYLALNRSASLLWPALVEGAHTRALARQLREAYGLAEDQAARDVAAFVEALRRLAVLEESPPPR